MNISFCRPCRFYAAIQTVPHKLYGRFRSSLYALITIVMLPLGLCADENYFGYTYGSEIIPKGHWELYQWVTSRTGSADGTYRAVDLQTEIEHGFTERLQGSLYLNAVMHDISQVGGLNDRNQFRFNGLQSSLKYLFRSLYKDGYGLALYFEPGYKRYSTKTGNREDIFFLEPKLIVQKDFLADTLILAANFSGEFERGHDLSAQTWKSELELQFSAGLSYRFAPNWFAGVEALATSSFERMHLDQLGEYAVFAGPNLHFAAKYWWMTLTILPQLTGWPETEGRRDLAHFEKQQVRLKVGINF